MADTYTFELTFTGLCIFTFEGDKRNPKSVNALLVNATGVGNGNGGGHVHHQNDEHVSRLNFDARNLVGFPDPPHELMPGLAGAHLGTIALSGHSVKVVPEAQHLPPLETVWRPQGSQLPQEPAQPQDERWLDWAMALQRINRETPDPSASMPHAGLRPDRFIASVSIPCGTLEARGFMRRWIQNAWRYVRWDFRAPTNGAASAGTHAMAESVVLSIPDLPVNKPVRIEGDHFDVRLVPVRRLDGTFEDIVKASVTNLPTAAVPTHELRPYLHHFEYFYGTVDFGNGQPSSLRLPHPQPPATIIHPVTRDNSYCPPTSHTEAD